MEALMATEVKLERGWFLKDARKAAERLNEWSTPRHLIRSQTQNAVQQTASRAPSKGKHARKG